MKKLIGTVLCLGLGSLSIGLAKPLPVISNGDLIRAIEQVNQSVQKLNQTTQQVLNASQNTEVMQKNWFKLKNNELFPEQGAQQLWQDNQVDNLMGGFSGSTVSTGGLTDLSQDNVVQNVNPEASALSSLVSQATQGGGSSSLAPSIDANWFSDVSTASPTHLQRMQVIQSARTNLLLSQIAHNQQQMLKVQAVELAQLVKNDAHIRSNQQAIIQGQDRLVTALVTISQRILKNMK